MVTLHRRTENGDLLEASFFPDKGMNLHSFKRNQIEVIEQSTQAEFEERYAGLGALIGPHFHRRSDALLHPIENEALFPHIARVHAKGIKDPFSHGISRYAPWQFKATENTISAVLKGSDQWNGISLSTLEGQNFKMTYDASLTSIGLEISLSIVSDTDSLVGIHYYYALPRKQGVITSRVQKKCLINGKLSDIPPEWRLDEQNNLHYSLQNTVDSTFFPYPDPLGGTIVLDAGTYHLKTTYRAQSQENSWQLYHPLNASFVCIEPLSSQDPRHPNLTVSSLKITLEILQDF